MNRELAELIFSVVLSTQWTSIYDKEIQELSGSHSLSFYVLDKCSCRSVYLAVCPVQFALYVKLRTMKRAAHVFSVSTINKYIGDYNEHIDACDNIDNRINIGSDVFCRVNFMFLSKILKWLGLIESLAMHY